jgi:hypothetical protein
VGALFSNLSGPKTGADGATPIQRPSTECQDERRTDMKRYLPVSLISLAAFLFMFIGSSTLVGRADRTTRANSETAIASSFDKNVAPRLYTFASHPGLLNPLTSSTTLTGDVFPPPLGVNFVTGDPGNTGLIGRASGNMWYFSGIALPSVCGDTTYWGPSNGRVRLSFVSSGFPNPGEVLTFQSGLSNLAGGIAVWTGQTFIPGSGSPVFTRFTMTVNSHSGGVPGTTGAPIALTNPTTVGLATNVGALVPVPPGIDYRVNMRFDASFTNGSGYQPALDFYDAQTTAGGTAFESFLAGFYYYNTFPTLSHIGNQITNINVALGPLSFFVSDCETSPSSLVVSATSSNTTLVPNTNIAFGGSGTSRNMTITPATGQSGTTTITYAVFDGIDTTSDSFVLTVNAPPTISAATGLSRQQGTAATNSQIATVTDDGGNGSVNVTVTSANPSNGVMISNIVNTSGNITADIVAGCTATTATFTLQASDGSLTATDTLTVTVTSNTAPSLVYSSPQSVSFGGALNVTPTSASDNGTITGYAVQSGHGLTTAPTVDASGVVSITNAQPAGAHTITIRATDNCSVTTDATFTLEVAPQPPTLGTYPNTSVALGANSTVTPDATPTNATSINVSSSTNFKGTFSADPATGVVRVTNAHPAGTHTVTVTAFNGSVVNTTKMFTLTVQAGTACTGASIFSNAADSSVGAAPVSVAIGDFNNDGKQDIAAANNNSNTVSIRLGDGAGGFTGTTNVSVGTLPFSVAIGDFNGDGKQDIAVASAGSNLISIRLGNGAGGFSGTTEVSVGSYPYSIAIGDFNNDGKQDFAAANQLANTVSIRLGNGAGGFSGTTEVGVGSRPFSIAIGDFNSDGKQDFAVAHEGSNGVSIRLGDGAGGFSGTTEVSVGSAPYSVAIGDFNNDGKQDIAAANSASTTVSIRLGDGLGGFSGTTNVSVGDAPYSVAIGDFNNDGKQDFAAANFDSDTVSIRLGDGSGGFSGTTNVSVGSEPFSVAIGDFNGDGKQDFAAANSNYVSIRLGTCNHPPTISDVPNQLTQKNQATVAIPITIGDVDDLTGNSLNMSGNSSNTTLVPNANIVFAGSGNNRTVTITPANNQTGTATITVTVTDAFGATASDTFDLRVNAPPVFGTNNGLTLNQGATATITNSMLNATDADNTPAQLRYTIASSPNGGPTHQGTLRLSTVALTSGSFFTQDDVNNNRLTYTHDDSNNTSDDFQFNITDGDGATLPNDGVHFSFSFAISITLINHAPVAVNGNGTTGLGAPFNGTFAATDRDLPAQTLTRRIVTNGTKGVAVLNNATTGAFTYTPNAGQTGQDTIIFQVNDGSIDSVNPGTFTITMQNQPPTAQNGSGTTNEGVALSSTLMAADPDQPPHPLTFAIVNNPTKGNVNITNTATGAFTYTPNANAIGADSFTFTASDGLLTSAPGTFSINIHPNLDAGDIFVTNSTQTGNGQVGSVIQIDPNNGMQSLVTTGGNLTNPSAIIIEHDGNLVVINNNNSVFRLVRINPATGTQSLIPTGPSFANPVGLGIGPGADIFVADPFAHCVFEVNPTTGAQVHVFSGGNLGAPAGLAFDSNGNLLVSDAAGLFGGASKIVRINTTTDAQTVVSSGGNLLLPVDITLDGNGDIIVSDAPNIFGPGTGLLIRVNATSGAQTVITGTGLGKPSGVAVDQSSNNSFTPDNSGPTVLKTTPGGTTTTTATGEYLSQPFGIVMVRCEPNDAPVAAPGGPYTADLGSGLTLIGSGSSDPDSACGDSIVNYSWNIAGTVSLSGATPSLTAAQVNSLGVGSHTVSLTVTDVLGLTGTATTTLTIYDNRPFASFTANPNPAACSQSVSFNASASSHGRPDRSIVSYAWTFGDGATGSGVMVSHAYAAYGNYTATLTVTDNNVPAKTAMASTIVNVNQGNQAPVSVPGGPYTADLGSGVTLNGTGSSDPNAGCGDSIASYSWSIDSGAVILSGASPSLTAAQVSARGIGSHPVVLTVTDTFGVSGSASTTLNIYDNRPFASFTTSPNPAACNQAVSFNGSGSTHGRPDRSIVSYAWNFGDGQTGTGVSVNHTYHSFGFFNATLTVTDNNVPAKTDFVSHSILVNQGNNAPTAVTGGPYTAYLGSGVTLNGSGSSDPDAGCGDSIGSYSWSIDSGAVTLTGVMPSLSAAQINALGVGVHSVQLTVRDSFGASGTSSTTLTINAVATLGNYPNTSVALSGNTTVTPDAAPTNTTSINVSASTSFKGKVEGDATTGVVRVTDAHPAGLYTITVTAFRNGLTTTKTFALTVTTPATCNPVSFAAATNFGVGTSPFSVVVGDFNGDGKQDLAVANPDSNNVSILLGDGAGSFSATNVGVGTDPGYLAVGDFNGDGKQDLAVADIGAASVSILLGNGAGSFSAATNFGVGINPASVAVGDFNNDGKQDLAVVNQNPSNVSVLLGDGAGSFSAATNFGVGANPVSVAVGDFNADGRQDLAVANSGSTSNSVSILLGDGAGSFTAATNFDVGSLPQSVAVGDFNGDGKQDLAAANFSTNNVSILLGNGAGSFSAANNFGVGANNPRSVAVGDFNGDGQQDLAVASFNSDAVSVLLGDGAGSFSAAANLGVGDGPRSVAVGDFNGDGKQDLATANTNSNNVSVLLRQCQPTLSINSTATQTEGDSGQANMTFVVTLSSSSSQTVTVHYSTANGSVNPALGGATCGGMVDYVTTSGVLTFAPNETVKTIAVPICGDTTDEPDETFTVTLDTPGNATIASGTGTATITDNDPMPTITISNVTQNEGDSGATAFNLTVTLANPSQGTITVDFATQNDSATQPSDYTLNTGTLNFSPGDTQKTITVQVNGDTSFEPNETFFVNLTNNSSNSILTANTKGTGTITNDDSPPSFAIDDVTHNEGNASTSSYTFTVTKTGSTALNSAVNFTTVDGSAATANNDYQLNSGTLNFLPTDTTKQITVLVNGDTTFEANEAFTVHLSGPSGATIADADGTGTITNDDSAPSFAIDDVTHNEGNAGTTLYTFTVTKTGGTALNSSVNFTTVDGSATTANNDYQLNTGTLNFLPADTTKQIIVLVTGDTSVEPDEAFTVHLSGASSATISGADGTGTIINDDCSFSLSKNTENFSAGGGMNSVNVITATGCAWTAVSNDTFISVNSGTPGSGNGTVNYSVGANTGPARMGTMTIAGITFTVTQGSGCTFALDRDHQSFAGNGGNGTVNVTTSDPGCAWTASTTSTFITITSGSAGSGNGAVQYTVAINGGSTIRSDMITIAGHTYTVYQGINFLDVPSNDLFYNDIGKLSARGVTVGCGNGNYCPSSPVTREQMAAFIMRAKGEFNPPMPSTQRFNDVSPQNVFYNFIDRMAVLGITVGCTPDHLMYCPSDPVKREQMAAFILRGLGEFNPPMPSTQRFNDVPPQNVFYNFIDRLAVLQITLGCTPDHLQYCPNDSVTRAQMAAFLVRAFNL